MTTTATETIAPEVPARRGFGARAVDLFRDPARTFLVLAIVAGGYLACVVPHFGGIDEPAHFYRSYQISTGHFVPEKSGKSGFSGACIPLDVIIGVARDQGVVFAHNITLQGRPAPHLPPVSTAQVQRCPSDRSKGFVTFSTFGSPIPYLPQAAAIRVTRSVGMGADGMLVAARLAMLAVYVAIVWIAIRRSPRAKWALCAVGLLPVAVFQSASSVSHDALTTAVSLLVLSSALRALDPPPDATPRSLFVEAAGLSTLLGLCKPIYVVIAVCYLLPLLGPRRRKELWPLVFAPVVGGIVSVGWNEVVGNLWKSDSVYFGVHPDPSHQKHELLTAPWDFVLDSARTVVSHGLGWLKTLVDVGPSVTKWPWALAVVLLLLYAAVAIQRDRYEPASLHWQHRLLVVVVLIVGVLGVIAANYVYWTDPGLSEVGGVQPRYLVPLLALLLVAVGTPRFVWARADTARVPAAVFLVPALLVFCVSVTFRMY